MSKQDGGPAFPARHRYHIGRQEGMTLRDYFAGQALAAVYTRCDASPHAEVRTAEAVAKCAYNVADAMLAAREGGA